MSRAQVGEIVAYVEKRRRAGRQLGRAAQGLRRGRDHSAAEEAIGGPPGFAHIGREIETEPLLERPHQSGTDAGIVPFMHTVAAMTPCQRRRVWTAMRACAGSAGVTLCPPV